MTWSFGYRRLHTVAEDTLGGFTTQLTGNRCVELRCASYPDPDDLIFPRTTTRLGAKYQASIPLKDGPRDPGKNKAPSLILWTHEATEDIQERGGEATVEALSLLHDMSDSQGEHFLSLRLPSLNTHGPFYSVSGRA